MMNLETFLQTIGNSAPDDWFKADVQHVFKWTWASEGGEVDDLLEPVTFTKLAVYKPDIDISVLMSAWVRASSQPDLLKEPWMDATGVTKPWGNKAAVLLRYRGAVVYQWIGVELDEGRTLLPYPRYGPDSGRFFRASEMPLSRLLYHLHDPQALSSFDDFVKRCGVPVK
jgi:hypothetical protein